MLLLLIFPVISFSSSLKCVNSEELNKAFGYKIYNLAFVLYDVENNQIYCYNNKEAEKRYYPASTFKIYDILIELESCVIKDENELFYKYDGKDIFLESWKQDTSLALCMKTSNIDAYKYLAN